MKALQVCDVILDVLEEGLDHISCIGAQGMQGQTCRDGN